MGARSSLAQHVVQDAGERFTEYRRHLWRDRGVVVIDPARDTLSWSEREMAKAIAAKLFGPRKGRACR